MWPGLAPNRMELAARRPGLQISWKAKEEAILQEEEEEVKRERHAPGFIAAVGETEETVPGTHMIISSSRGFVRLIFDLYTSGLMFIGSDGLDGQWFDDYQ